MIKSFQTPSESPTSHTLTVIIIIHVTFSTVSTFNWKALILKFLKYFFYSKDRLFCKIFFFLFIVTFSVSWNELWLNITIFYETKNILLSTPLKMQSWLKGWIYQYFSINQWENVYNAEFTTKLKQNLSGTHRFDKTKWKLFKGYRKNTAPSQSLHLSPLSV